MNQVIIIGRLTKEAEIKVAANDNTKQMANFTLAVNREYKLTDGTIPADFINCVAFGNQAGTIAKFTNKGDRLGVIGRIQTRTFTAQDGTNRYVTEILVERVEFLEPVKQPNQDARETKKAPQPEQPKINVEYDESIPF